ncbi:MAG: hypothetical protein SNG27_10765 [Rikenellaceae bacterium]
MKKWIEIIFWAIVALVGSRFYGGLGWWIAAIVIGRPIIKLMFAVTLGLVLYALFYIAIFGGIVWMLIQ